MKTKSLPAVALQIDTWRRKGQVWATLWYHGGHEKRHSLIHCLESLVPIFTENMTGANTLECVKGVGAFISHHQTDTKACVWNLTKRSQREWSSYQFRHVEHRRGNQTAWTDWWRSGLVVDCTPLIPVKCWDGWRFWKYTARQGTQSQSQSKFNANSWSIYQL